MIETLTINSPTKENKNQCEYMNAFGVVFNNYFTVYNISTKITLNIEDTKGVGIRKIRKMKKNIFLISISVYMVIGTYYVDLTFINKIIFSSIAILLLAVGIFFKEYQYKFRIVKYNDFIEFEIKRSLKDDAKKIQKCINDKLKEESS